MATKEIIASNIENSFRKQVQLDKKVKNAYLLIDSEKLGIHLNIAEGKTGEIEANPQQPNYMASVGKLFTSTVISILYEEEKLDFNDKISKYLDKDLLNNLHVYKGVDYTNQIEIRHLLNQTSGLYDVFWPLMDKILKNPELKITPREAIIWGKENLKPRFQPGKKHYYTDTNYYLLGLIIENITQKPFHDALHHYIFKPLNMQNSYMMGFSEPAEKPEFPLAGFYINGVDVSKIQGIAGIDYAGGGVVATLDDYLKFMKALVDCKIVKEETLQLMISDDYRSYPNIRYGYAIWKVVTVPIIMPETFNCWGCVGVTGAFMFYHPKTESYIIGNFNDLSYRSKALRFMLSKIIKQLLKL
ncbi:MAG: serine hydrolase domain-containing protein [Actinomycetota bacterium]